MRIKTPVAAAALALLVACGGQPVQLNNPDELPPVRWQGTLASPPDLQGAVEMSGTAWMAEGEAEGTTHVEVRIENAAPGGVHPWQVSRGACGSERGSLGTPSAIDPIEIDDDGEGLGTADLQVRFPMNGDYAITLFASPSNRDLVVACANLAPPVAG